MKSTTVVLSICISFAAAGLIVAPTASLAKSPVNANFSGVVVKGYDAVAYFTESKPIKGKNKFPGR